MTFEVEDGKATALVLHQNGQDTKAAEDQIIDPQRPQMNRFQRRRFLLTALLATIVGLVVWPDQPLSAAASLRYIG